MRAFEFSRCVLIISIPGLLLSACSGASAVPVPTGDVFVNATGAKHHKTFSYTGKEETFIVPAGVTRLTVVARGGEGAGAFDHGSGFPGYPGRIYVVVRVQAGDKLQVRVAEAGRNGGFNGGGSGAYGFGGGASDVRMGGDTLTDRIIVAAGGGAGGNCFLYCYADGGDGGGLKGTSGSGAIGGTGSGGGGAGGTQKAGGRGGAGGEGKQRSGNGKPGGNGALGAGGNGGVGGEITGSASQTGLPGGGGGGGYYGGGGGGGSSSAPYSYLDFGSGGGGGGSSYVEPSAITSHMWTGWRGVGNGDGQVIFSWK